MPLFNLKGMFLSLVAFWLMDVLLSNKKEHVIYRADKYVCCSRSMFNSSWTSNVSCIEVRVAPLHLPSSQNGGVAVLRSPKCHMNVSILATCLSSSDKLTNQLEVSVWRIISLFSIKIAGLQILPFHFAACLLPSTFHNSSVTPAIFHMPRSNITTPPPAFEGVKQTGELNAFLMSQRQLESGD